MKRQATSSAPLARVRAVIATMQLDCDCRQRLDSALERFEALEHQRALRSLMRDARRQVERIAAALDLLRELDGVTIDEDDGSIFEELALLFDDIAAAAQEGAADLRRVDEARCGVAKTRA